MLCYLTIGERVSLTAAPWTTAASWGRYWMPDFAKIRICFHYGAGTPLASYLALGSDKDVGMWQDSVPREVIVLNRPYMITTVKKGEKPIWIELSWHSDCIQRARDRREERREKSQVCLKWSLLKTFQQDCMKSAWVKNSFSGSCLSRNVCLELDMSSIDLQVLIKLYCFDIVWSVVKCSCTML